MKLINKTIQATKGILLLVALGLGSSALKAQLNGNYTIDPTTATGGTNYQTWAAFASAYNAAAITGPVVVDVKGNASNAGTNITLTANAGASSTNTLTINGNGYKMTYTGTNAALRLNGADYVTVKDLTIECTSTTPGGIWFTNQADNNTIDDVEISFTANTSATSSVYYIAMSTSVTSATSYGSAATGTTGQPGSNNTISNCYMHTATGNVGPYYAVTMNGNSSTYSTVAQNNTLTGCTISNFYYYGFYQYYTNGNQIIGNDFSRNDATSGGSTTMYGIYSYYSYSKTRSAAISNNKLHDLPFKGASLTTTTLATLYGIYAYYQYGNSSYSNQFTGNTIMDAFVTGTLYGTYVYYPQYMNFSGNTIDNLESSGTSSTIYANYIYYPSYCTISKNTVQNMLANYYLYNMYIYYSSYCDILENTVQNNENKYTSGYVYNFYVYYPTAVRFNGNKILNNKSNYYMYSVYMYYGSVGTRQWNEFQDNTISGNVSVNYNYSAYIYYYNGTNHFQINRNYIVGNSATGNTGYHYIYLYYLQNYQVTNNVFAGNYANSQYIYIYSGLSGYTAEIRNNTFQANTAGVPTPGSSYIYCYLYLYYHTVYFTGNIIDLKGGGSNYYRYLYMYLSYSVPANLKEFNYNTYSLNNLFTYPYWYFNGTNYTDWLGFSGAGMNGSKDNDVDPLFVDKANNDWRAGSWMVQNNVPYLPINDVDEANVSRNKIKHDRGGLEINTDLEALATNFSVPDSVCAGYTTGATWISLKSNYAYDLARDFTVSYSVNGGPKTSTLVKKKLAQGDTALIYFPTPLVLNSYGPARIAIFVDLPDDDNSNDSFIFNTLVKEAPGGGVMTFTTSPTQANYQPSKSFDVTILGQSVEYAVNSPRVYSNSDYKGNGGGDNWQAFVSAQTQYGKTVSGASMVAPTGSNDMLVKFVTSDNTLEDSIITLICRVYDLTNTCDTIIKRDILIYPTIVPDFTKPTQACLGQNILFENKSAVTSGNMEFEWDFGTGNASDKTDAPDPVFAYNKEGTYKVKMTAKTLPYGFPSYDSATIVVNPIPVVDFSKKNACAGYNLEFTNKTSPPNSTLSWDFGDGKGSSTQSYPLYKYSKSGSYDVTLTANLNGCIAKTHQIVYQFENPKADFDVQSGVCENIPFDFENKSSISNGFIGSYWMFDDGSISTNPNPTHDFLSSGNKQVRLVITSEFGCKDSITKSVKVNESPKVNFIHGPACSLTPTAFTNLTPAINGTVANFYWIFSDGAQSGIESPNKSWSTLGPKTATLTVKLDNGCEETFSKSLDVLVQPKAKFTASDVCAGEPITFNNASEWKEGNISYKWDFGDGNTSTESDPVHPYFVNLTTTYNVTLIASIAGGCKDSVTRQVLINEGPKTCDFVATPDYSYGFYGMSFQPVDANGQPGAQGTVDYSWIIENGGKKSGSSLQYNFLKDGIYTVTMYAITKNTGCACSQTKQVVMNRTGVEELNNTGVALFPNPTQDQFNLLLSADFSQNTRIEVRSMSGALVKSHNSTNNSLVQVNCQDLSDGMYLVYIIDGNHSAVKKLQIAHN
jgi:parallel beta-helix repeat protein